MEKKTFTAPIKLDDGNEGTFRSVFSTLGVIDHDEDVTRPGAFKEGQEVVVEGWNHDYGLPVGKAVIHQSETEAWADGRFILETQAGRDHYTTLKALGGIEEWSYTFSIDDAEFGKVDGRDVRFLNALDVWGIAPVVRGAGINTRTMALKSAKRALPSHSTATTDAAWDGPANEARARSGKSTAYYRRIYAWADPEGDPAVKSTYKFVHHQVDGDGNPGAANIRGCQTAIGVLNGGRGGTTIPDADRRGVWNHLAAHLRDADLEPPELKGEGEGREVKPSDDLLTRINICEIEIRSLL